MIAIQRQLHADRFSRCAIRLAIQAWAALWPLSQQLDSLQQLLLDPPSHDLSLQSPIGGSFRCMPPLAGSRSYFPSQTC